MRDLRQMEVLRQTGPACGTTSLAMIIRFLTDEKGITPQDIDQEMRKSSGMFSAPADLIAYARRKGLPAEEYNHGSLQQIENFVTQGIPVMPLLDLTPENAMDFDRWHWVVVLAVDKRDGHKTIIINNPWGQQEEWAEEKFSREWAYLRLFGLTFGYDNYFIAIDGPGDSLPPRRAEGTGPANAVTKGLADIINGFYTVRRERKAGGLVQIFGGVFILVRGAAFIIIYNLGRKLKLVGLDDLK
jgi:hypothetical protein